MANKSGRLIRDYSQNGLVGRPSDYESSIMSPGIKAPRHQGTTKDWGTLSAMQVLCLKTDEAVPTPRHYDALQYAASGVCRIPKVR